MKKSKFTEQQIAFALRQAETGTKVKEIVRQMGTNAHDHRAVFHTVTYRCFQKPSFFPYAQRALFPVKVLLETGRNRGPRRGESDAGQTRFLSEPVQWNTRLGV
jgi:hypothetical protein